VNYVINRRRGKSIAIALFFLFSFSFGCIVAEDQSFFCKFSPGIARSIFHSVSDHFHVPYTDSVTIDFLCDDPSDDLFVDYLLDRCEVEKNKQTREACWAILETVLTKYENRMTDDTPDSEVDIALANKVTQEIVDLVKKIKDGVVSLSVDGSTVRPKKRKWKRYLLLGLLLLGLTITVVLTVYLIIRKRQKAKAALEHQAQERARVAQELMVSRKAAEALRVNAEDEARKSARRQGLLEEKEELVSSLEERLGAREQDVVALHAKEVQAQQNIATRDAQLGRQANAIGTLEEQVTERDRTLEGRAQALAAERFLVVQRDDRVTTLQGERNQLRVIEAQQTVLLGRTQYELHGTQEELRGTQEALRRERDGRVALAGDIRRREHAIKGLRERHEKQDGKIKEVNEQCEQLHHDLDAHKVDLLRLQDEGEVKSADIATLRRIEKKHQENEGVLRGEFYKRESIIRDLNQEVSSREGSIESLKEERRTLQRELNGQKTSFGAGQREIEEKSGTIEVLRTQLERYREQKGVIDRTEFAMDELRAQVAQHEGANKILREQIEQVTRGNVENTTVMQRQQSELGDLSRDQERLRYGQAAERARLEKVIEEQCTREVEQSDTMIELHDRNEQLQHRTEQLQDRNERHQQQNEEHQAMNRQLTNRNEELQAEHARVEGELRGEVEGLGEEQQQEHMRFEQQRDELTRVSALLDAMRIDLAAERDVAHRLRDRTAQAERWFVALRLLTDNELLPDAVLYEVVQEISGVENIGYREAVAITNRVLEERNQAGQRPDVPESFSIPALLASIGFLGAGAGGAGVVQSSVGSPPSSTGSDASYDTMPPPPPPRRAHFMPPTGGFNAPSQPTSSGYTPQPFSHAFSGAGV